MVASGSSQETHLSKISGIQNVVGPQASRQSTDSTTAILIIIIIMISFAQRNNLLARLIPRSCSHHATQDHDMISRIHSSSSSTVVVVVVPRIALALLFQHHIQGTLWQQLEGTAGKFRGLDPWPTSGGTRLRLVGSNRIIMRIVMLMRIFMMLMITTVTTVLAQNRHQILLRGSQELEDTPTGGDKGIFGKRMIIE